jgi:signal transduction histidine kinase
LWQLFYWKRVSPLKYGQIKYVLFALILYFLSSVDFLVNYGFDFYPFGFLFILGFLGVFAYAILKYRLFDIRLVLRKSSVIAASLAVVFALAIPAMYFIDKYSQPVIAFWGDLLVIATAVYIYPFIRERFFYIANKYFFTSLYDGRQVITEISENFRTNLDTDLICQSLYSILGESFHFKAFALFAYDREKAGYKVEFVRGLRAARGEFYSGKDLLPRGFARAGKPMIIEEMEKRYEKIWDKKAINLLKQMKADILMPLNVKDKTIGLLVLGPKETGDMYNDEDIQILEIAGAQAAIAIENAWLFEETKKFNVKLKQEVDRATADLKQANTKLKRLDVAKSEFISIASHQLRTPLTVIKGYISMILEGSFGKISKTQKESLEKVYESSERLIQLIENLLNISRIESGRLQYSFMPLDLEKLVANVVEELESVAKKKGLRFTYKKPKTALPTLKLDEEKLRQVIMNLIDNSIKYTKQGSVTVSLYQKDNRVIFSVKDTGIGIDEEGKDNLFKKFSRGTGTSLIHTEGTGLGLYVAKQIVEGHGGDIRVESPGEGKGSEFLVSLPVESKIRNA